MKKIILFFSLLLTSFLGYSQTKGINYQAVIIDPTPIEIPGKDVSAQPFVNKEVWLRFTISQDGTLQYQEIQKTKTDNYGLVNLTIGTGINTGKGGTFASLNWAGNVKNILTEVSFTGGTNYVVVGNQMLNYVPYSLFSETANKLAGVLPISAGGTGAISSTAARANLGLDKVDNTSDLDKPVSTATLAILDAKESLANKSINIEADSASTVKYPSVKAIKDYIDSRNSASANSARLAAKATALETPRTINGIPFDGTANITIPVGVTPPDASASAKGLVKLAGDLSGTADSPTIAAGAVTTTKILDAAVTDAKIATVSGSKVTGNITGNAANVTGTVAIANGGTGATTAADARTNLGLVIGTDVLAQRTFGTAANSATTDFIAITEKAANNGVATLGNDGKIPSVQIPAISFQNVSVVNSANAMTNINGAQVGSIAIRTDNNNNYVLSALPASNASNWIQLASSNYVSSVNGFPGPNVVLTTNDVAEGSTNKYYTDARVRGAISATGPLSYNASTGNFSMTAASASANGYLSSADWTTFNNKQTALTAGVDYATPSGNITGNAANVTGIVSIANGGTGTSTASGALVALGAEASSNKSNDILVDGNSTTKFPTFKAIKDYVDQQSANAGVADNSITSAKINGTLAVLKGGTGAANAADARTNLGLVIGTNVMAANFTTTLTGDVAGSGNGSFATTVNSVGGVSSSTIATLPTNVAANTASITTNANSIATLNTNVAANTASITANSNDLALKAPLASPAFTGTPTAPTPATSDNSTKVATTEYVKNSIVAANAGLSSIGAISATSNAKGATISGTTELILTPADITNGGVVTTGAQTFAGAKTFTNTTIFGTDIKVNGMNLGRPGMPTYTENTAVGFGVLASYAPTSWQYTYNTGVGNNALRSLTNGGNNTAVGNNALYYALTSRFNTAVGADALVNSTESNNVGIGASSGVRLTTGRDNVMVGYLSGFGMTTGSNNTIVGSQTYSQTSGAIQIGLGITTGSNNTIIGSKIFGLAPTLSNNVILADGAGNIRAQHDGTTGWTLGTISSGIWSGTVISAAKGGTGLTSPGASGNVLTSDGTNWVSSALPVSGVSTLAYSTTAAANGGTISGTTLTLAAANGSNPGLVSTGAQTFAGAKTFSSDATISGITVGVGTGSQASNAVLGKTAMTNNTTGNNTVAVGFEALKANTFSNYNTAVGSTALSANNNADANTAVGFAALTASQSGGYNTAVGSNSLAANVSGSLNTGLGNTALYTNTSGSNNTAVGNKALFSNTTGSNNTAIGYEADVASAALTNATAIGNGAVVSASNRIQLGNANVTSVVTSGTISATGFTGPLTGNATTATTATNLAGGVSGSIPYQTAAGTTAMIPVGSANQVLTSVAGGTYTWTTPASGIGGSGTVNYLPKFNGSTTILGNSNLFDDGTSVFVNATSGAGGNKFVINSGARTLPATTGTTQSGGALRLGGSSNDVMDMGIGSLNGWIQVADKLNLGFNYSLLLNPNGGNVGIGVTAAPSSKLEVAGNIKAASINEMVVNTKGSNVILGQGNVLGSLTTGANNVAVGQYTLNYLESGSENLGMGYSAMYNTRGSNNVGLGHNSLWSNNTGNNNTALGHSSGYANTGSNNTFLGYQSNSSGSVTNATAIGNGAVVSASNRIQLGNADVTSVVTSGTISATGFTGPLTGNASTATALAVGKTISLTGDVTYTSGAFDGSSNVTGSATLTNTAVTAGTYGSSTAIPTFTVDSKGRLTAAGTVGITAGVSTLAYSTTGSSNGGTISGTTLTLTAADASNPGLISTGAQTIAGAKTFNSDLVVNGMTVGKGGGNVANNTALGFNALTANVSSGTPGINNTAMGYNALSANTTGGNNVAIGNSAGSVNVGGSNNVFIGNNANAAAGLVNNANAIAIGSNAIVDAANKIQLGDQNITAVNTSGIITAAGFTGPLTGNATTATTAGNITATSNTTLASLANLATVGTITSGTWSASTIDIAKGGTGATTPAAARTNLGLGTLATNSSISNADVASGAAIAFSKLNITKADITGLGVQDGLTAGSGISISAGVISATGLTTANLASNAGITNAQLANSTTILGSTTMTLGGTVTSVAGLTSVTSTGFTGALTGNASTATKLAATKNINGVAFDGSADITIAADANTLTGTTLASNVVNSSLTSVGTITTGVWSGTTISIAKGGTGATTKATGFDALSPMTTSGDIIYGGASGTGTRLAKGTDGQVLTLASGIPSWAAISAVTSLGTFTTTAYTAGGTINGSTLTLSAADGTKPGLVSTVAQTIAGAKTFSADIFTNNDVRVGKGVAGNTSNTVVGKLALGGTSIVTNENVFNTAIGISAMQNSSGTGSYNTAVGANSAFFNNSGSHNTYLGYQTGYSTTSGTKNVAIGSGALYGSTTGNYLTGEGNNAIGFEAMKDISTTASDNIAIGLSAGTKLTTGTKNIFIGSLAGKSISTGSSANTTGLNSVLIGYDVRPLANADDNEIVISGYNGSAGTVGLGSNTTLIGSSTTITARIMGALTLPNTTASSSSTTGALIVSGGTGIAGALNVGGATTITGAATISNTTASTSSTTGALIVRGGVGVAGALNVEGNTAIAGTIEIDGGSPGAGKVLVSDANGLASWSANSNGGVSSISASATMAATDNYNFIVFSGSTASQTITLPSASLAGAGREITIKNIASVSVAVNATAGNLISDSTTTTATSLNIGIEPSNNWIKAISNGTNWIILRALF